jgi:hypothetical protein
MPNQLDRTFAQLAELKVARDLSYLRQYKKHAVGS